MWSTQPWIGLGCDEALYRELRAMDPDYRRTPVGRYRAHFHGAAERNVPFELTLTQWWEIWKESGHYAERGCHIGQYNMARKYDRGAYAVGNVEIVTVGANHETRWWTHRVRKVRRRGGSDYSGRPTLNHLGLTGELLDSTTAAISALLPSSPKSAPPAPFRDRQVWDPRIRAYRLVPVTDERKRG